MAKRLYREFYLLPRGEQRALLLLSLLLILSLAFRMVVQFLPDREPAGMEEFEQEAHVIMATLARVDSLQRAKNDSNRQSVPGFGHTLRPAYQSKQSRTSFPIDLNRADSVQLLPLPGIGPVFARRIIKYRTLLGGYARVDQLMEVYGMKEETLDLVKDKIFADITAIRTINLDSASFKDLLRHPYLEYEDVKALVKYRDFKGKILSKQELQDNFILADSVLQKVLPYLGLE
jgi:DNA uptake protein ComE-like DNA-binding protein